MLELWSGLYQALAQVVSFDPGLPAAVRGVALGMLFGLAVPVSLLGITVLAERWGPRRRRIVPSQSTRRVRRGVVPPDDWTPDLGQFTAAELVRLQRLRRAYRAGLHQPTPDRQ